MTKYQSYSSHVQSPKKKEIHPIWRIIGILLMVIIPIVAYSLSILLYKANLDQGWMAIPGGLIMRGWSDPTLLVKILLTVIIAFILYALVTFFSFFIYGIFGPSRYGPYDVPPSQFTGKKHSR